MGDIRQFINHHDEWESNGVNCFTGKATIKFEDDTVDNWAAVSVPMAEANGIYLVNGVATTGTQVSLMITELGIHRRKLCFETTYSQINGAQFDGCTQVFEVTVSGPGCRYFNKPAVPDLLVKVAEAVTLNYDLFKEQITQESACIDSNDHVLGYKPIDASADPGYNGIAASTILSTSS